MAETSISRPQVRPVRRTFVPIRRSMVGTTAARGEFARAISALVTTLTEARAASDGLGDEVRLRGLVAQARHQLNLADEKLLMLDRREQRSLFLRADRLRDRLDHLQYRLACYYVERTFDEEGGPCQTDLQSRENSTKPSSAS